MKIGTIDTGLAKKDFMIDNYFSGLTVEIHAEAWDGSHLLYLCKKHKEGEGTYQATTIFMSSKGQFVSYTENPDAYYRVNNKDFLWLRGIDFSSISELEGTTNKDRVKLLRNVEEEE